MIDHLKSLTIQGWLLIAFLIVIALAFYFPLGFSLWSILIERHPVNEGSVMLLAWGLLGSVGSTRLVAKL